MRIRREQFDRSGPGRIQALRRDGLLSLRKRGFVVEAGQQEGNWSIRDAAGGSAEVLSRGVSASLTTSTGRTFHTEQYDYGRIRSLTGPGGHHAIFHRNDTGQLTALDSGDGRIHRFSIDTAERLHRIEYPDGTHTHSDYDSAGHLAAVTDRGGAVTRYTYTEEGLLACMTDARGHDTRLTYQGWDLPGLIHYPDGRTHEFRFAENGRLEQMLVDGSPHATFHIDPVTGLHESKYTDGTWTKYRVSQGRLVEAINAAVAVRLEYDDSGRLIAEHSGPQTVRYQRDATGALTGIIAPTGERLGYQRDADGRLTGITDWGGGHLAIQQPAAGPPEQLTFPNGIVATWGATPTGAIASMVLTDTRAGGRALESAQWHYDLCDRVTGATRGTQRLHYRYDRAGRLVAVEDSAARQQESYTLDAKGNRTAENGTQLEYDPADQLLRRGDHPFTHDALGNLTSGIGPQGSAEYTYNGGGQLIAAKTGAGLTHYTYDALGRRIRKQAGDRVTNYVWAGAQLLSETTTAPGLATQRDYLWDPDRAVPYAMREGGRTYYLHTGGRGEVLCMTSAEGRVVWRAAYSAFG
jgi:YD repeat-containing protein